MINSIDILEDGKLSAFTGADETYLQPEIIVDTLDSLQQLLIKDQFGNYVKVDTTITTIKGVAFAGTFADLETAIRDLALESNGLYNGGTGGGGGGGGDASAANQLIEISELQKLTAANLPSQEEITNPAAVVISAFKKLSFVCTGAISVTLNGNTIIYPYALGGAVILGAEFEADDTSTNSVTFNGTGTVLITTKQ